MIKLLIGFGTGILLIIVWVIFFPDDEAEEREYKQWILENW